MIGLTIWKKCVVWHIAKKDALSEYGEHLKRLPIGTENYPLSTFMETLADDYDRECKRVICSRKSIKRLYFKIILEYENLSTYTDMKDRRVSFIDFQKKKLEKELRDTLDRLELLSEYRKIANQTGIVTPEMGSATLGELKNKIDKLKEHIKSLEDEIGKIDEKMNEKKIERRKKINDENKCLYKHINMFGKKLDMIVREIEFIENKYEKILNYYWYIMTKQLDGIPVKQKKFSEICQLRGKKILKKEDLFRVERNIINSNIKKLTGFKIDV